MWGTADLVLKVKEPIAEEYHRLREGQILFTYLHLAADKPLTEELIERKVTGIAYETVQPPSGALPLLYPMSEVAGLLAPQVGPTHLMKAQAAVAACCWVVSAASPRQGRRHRCRRLRPERRQRSPWAWVPT